MSDIGDHNETTHFKLIVGLIRDKYRAREDNVPVSDNMWTDDRLGMRQLSDSPAVGWVRASGVLRPTEQTGPFRYFDTEDPAAKEYFFTAKYEDFATVEAHIVGHDGCQTENLWNQVLRATREALGKDVVPSTYTWPTQQQDGAAHMNAGQEKVIQLFDWRILVPHFRGTLTEIAALETEATLLDQTGGGGTSKNFTQP